MKKSDLKAGVLYGYRFASAKYGLVEPALLVDTDLWVSSPHQIPGERFRRATRETRCRGRRSPDDSTVGYLVVVPSGLAGADGMAEQIAALEIPDALELPDDLPGWALFVWDVKLRRRGVELDLVNNAKLLGEYDAAKAEEQERAAREGHR